jgi:hypothetical protein
MSFTLFTGHGAIPINPEKDGYLLIQHIGRLPQQLPNVQSKNNNLTERLSIIGYKILDILTVAASAVIFLC